MSPFLKYILVIAAVIFVQDVTAGPVKRSVDTSGSLQNILDSAKIQFQTVSAELNRLATSANVQEMTPVLINQTAQLRERVLVLSDGLKRQIESQDLNERTAAAMSEAVNRLNASIENLPVQNTASGEVATALQQQFKSTAEAFLEEMSKVARATSQDSGSANIELNNLSKNALANTMDVFSQLQTQFQEAMNRNRS